MGTVTPGFAHRRRIACAIAEGETMTLAFGVLESNPVQIVTRESAGCPGRPRMAAKNWCAACNDVPERANQVR
jgi:hypothetical protein